MDDQQLADIPAAHGYRGWMRVWVAPIGHGTGFAVGQRDQRARYGGSDRRSSPEAEDANFDEVEGPEEPGTCRRFGNER